MTDIVIRLRRQVSESPYDAFVSPLEAAAEIERLEADNARLRAALTRLVAWEGPVELECPELGGLLKAMYDARAALEGKYAS